MAVVSDFGFAVVFGGAEVTAGAAVVVVTEVVGGEVVAGVGVVPVETVAVAGGIVTLVTGGAVTLGDIPVTGIPVTAGRETVVAAVVSCGAVCLP